MSTTLRDPWQDTDNSAKSRIQSAIPTDTYERLFKAKLTMRGAQHCVVASLLDWFDKRMMQEVPINGFDVNNERKAQSILDELHSTLPSYEPTSI